MKRKKFLAHTNGNPFHWLLPLNINEADWLKGIRVILTDWLVT